MEGGMDERASVLIGVLHKGKQRKGRFSCTKKKREIKDRGWHQTILTLGIVAAGGRLAVGLLGRIAGLLGRVTGLGLVRGGLAVSRLAVAGLGLLGVLRGLGGIVALVLLRGIHICSGGCGGGGGVGVEAGGRKGQEWRRGVESGSIGRGWKGGIKWRARKEERERVRERAREM